MFFSSWLRKSSTKPRTSRRATSTFRPRVEVLEGRDLPSTLTVTNLYNNGPGSLRYEIAVAKSGDTIAFDGKLDGQTITLTLGELVIDKSLTIKGPGAIKLTITSQPYNNGFGTENGSRIFEVDGAGTTVTIGGLTMTDGGGTRRGSQGISGLPYDG